MSLSNLLLLNQQLVIENLSGQEFKALVAQIRTELPYNEIKKEYIIYTKDCNFEGTDFTGLNLSGIEFENCSFNNCIFDKESFISILPAIKQKVTLHGCTINSDLSRTLKSSGGIAVYSGARCEGLKAENCVFTQNTLGALFTGSLLQGCKFQGNSTNIILNDCNLLGSKFNCNLTKAKIKHANLQNVSFNESILEDAEFDGSNISGADFRGTGITPVQLVNTEGWEKAIFDNQEQMLSEIYILRRGNIIQQITEIAEFLIHGIMSEIDRLRTKFTKKAIDNQIAQPRNHIVAKSQFKQSVISTDEATLPTLKDLNPRHSKASENPITFKEVQEQATYLRKILSTSTKIAPKPVELVERTALSNTGI